MVCNYTVPAARQISIGTSRHDDKASSLLTKEKQADLLSCWC